MFRPGSAAQKKVCPKNAFLGLYGINENSKNAQYAKQALTYLRSAKKDEVTPAQLWDFVMSGEKKVYNSQMNVVLALFREGYIE